MITKDQFEQLVQVALAKNASVIIANDVVNFQDPDDVYYKIGIQSTGSKYLKGFCHLFWSSRFGAGLYLKHDQEQIHQLYAQFPQITPAGFAPQHWSCVLPDESIDAELLMGLMDKAYRLILETMPKGEQSKISALETPNNAWSFHQLGLRLRKQDPNWHIGYNTGPRIDYKIKMMAILEHHQFFLQRRLIAKEADWEPALWAAIQ